MITAFVDMVGLLMVIPLLPFYALEMGGTGLVVGVLVSSYAVAQLVSAPLWGRVSDRYGRRPALMVGLFFSCIAYVVFAFAGSLWVLLLSRLVQGAGGGTTGVIQAYVADATEPRTGRAAWGGSPPRPTWGSPSGRCSARSASPGASTRPACWRRASAWST
jgi:MFS family permease